MVVPVYFDIAYTTPSGQSMFPHLIASDPSHRALFFVSLLKIFIG